MRIGDRIREKREEKSMTQVELANSINVSKQTLYKYENNIVTNIPSDKIELLAEVLDTTPAFLMGWETRTVGWNIKRFRTEQGLSQSDLAVLSGLTESDIISYEDEKSKPSFEALKDISLALGIFIGNFIEDWSEYPESKNYDPFSFATPYSAFQVRVKRQADFEERTLLEYYRRLNSEGQKEARKRIQELTEIPRYTEIAVPLE